MRYSESHKAETHQKILKITSRALREKGPDGLAVAEVMKEAGLTHGGFYAHFKSKDALLGEALTSVFARASRNIDKMTEGLPPRHALATYVDFYVSPRHRDNPSTGCPITALNSDMPRQSKNFRDTFDWGVKVLVGRIAGWLAASGQPDPEALAASVLSAMAGAVAVSRAVSDKSLSDEMLEAARAGIKARLGVSDVELARSVN
ncbi:MAG TPA: TetR/AcrR family transcriptional regulator [Rhizomicrobium sp.]|nr:TetR/AcrR family transcriptional regulator [Rhizomicrobium sp.]